MCPEIAWPTSAARKSARKKSESEFSRRNPFRPSRDFPGAAIWSVVSEPDCHRVGDAADEDRDPYHEHRKQSPAGARRYGVVRGDLGLFPLGVLLPAAPFAVLDRRCERREHRYLTLEAGDLERPQGLGFRSADDP